MDATFGSVRCPLVIGRDDLLELADRRLDDVDRGHGQFLLIAGVAGIGKTRLLTAIERKARDRDYRDSWGHLAPQDQDLPGGSILDFARTMRAVPILAAAGNAVIRLLETAPSIGLTGRRRLALDIVEAILAAPDEPVMYGFEDLQWADDLSLDVIAELARRVRERRILLAATYRSDEAGPGSSLRDWRSRLVTQRLAEELRLGPLSAADTALVTTLILDSGLPAPKDVASAVFARTDGVPLYIEELLGAIGADARASGRAIRDAIVPDTIEDAVLRRLAHCSPEAQAAAQAGAVIGRCFTADVLAGVMDLPQEALDGPLQELIDRSLVIPPFEEGYYDFPHQLLRDAVYRSVKVGDRRRYHARAGEFGARLIGQSEIHASAHFERAGLRREAYVSALAGAMEAQRLSLHRESCDLYRRAVANMPEDVGPAERAPVLLAYAEEAQAIEENELSERVANEAASTFRSAGQPLAAIGALDLAQNVWRRECRSIESRIAGIEGLLAELDTLEDSPELQGRRFDLQFSLAIHLMDARRTDEAIALLDEIRAHGVRIGDREYVLMTDWKRGVAEMMGGATDAGSARVIEAARTGERLGYESMAVSAYRDAATFAAEAMDYASAARWAGAGLRYADSIQQSYCGNVMASTNAMVAWAGADWTDADAQARQRLTDHGCERAHEMARWVIGYVAMGRGALDVAASELEEALRSGEASQEVGLILPPTWGLAEVALLQGDPVAAFAHCQAAFGRARRLGERIHLTPFVVTGVRAAQSAGRPADAAAWLTACIDHLASIPDVAGAALAHGRGLVALADGATGVARIDLLAAIAGWDAHGRAWEAAWARLDLASCLLRSNRYADALPLTVEVRALASRIESRALADRADELARMARGHVSVDEPWRPLTAREYAVARLIAAGRTNGEIAEELGIAPKTASSHVEHILAKLGASRRAEIASWASSVERAPGDDAWPSSRPVIAGPPSVAVTDRSAENGRTANGSAARVRSVAPGS